MTLRTVAALVSANCSFFEFGVVAEVFGIDRTEEGVPAFDFRVCGPETSAGVPVANGVRMVTPYGYRDAEEADLVCVPAAGTEPVPEALCDTIRRAHARGAVIVSVCSGAFVLGQAGLLDGRDCTTHWRHTDELARRYPLARIEPGVLFVDTGDVITSAGTAAGIDACLHVVRREWGADVATTIARRMVVPPQRDGGQRQFIQQSIPPRGQGSFAALLDWLGEHLQHDHSVATLAERASMSERTFARRFRDETGTTPARWLTRQRVHRARQLLERSDLPIELVAAQVGFSSATLLRHHFHREVGVSPSAYRRSFAVTEQSAPSRP